MGDKTNYALSKSSFASAIENGKIKTKKEDFKNFNLIFNKLKEIVADKKETVGDQS